MKSAMDIVRLHYKLDKKYGNRKIITTHSNDPIEIRNALVLACLFKPVVCLTSFLSVV